MELARVQELLDRYHEAGDVNEDGASPGDAALWAQLRERLSPKLRGPIANYLATRDIKQYGASRKNVVSEGDEEEGPNPDACEEADENADDSQAAPEAPEELKKDTQHIDEIENEFFLILFRRMRQRRKARGQPLRITSDAFTNRMIQEAARPLFGSPRPREIDLLNLAIDEYLTCPEEIRSFRETQVGRRLHADFAARLRELLRDEAGRARLRRRWEGILNELGVSGNIDTRWRKLLAPFIAKGKINDAAIAKTAAPFAERALAKLGSGKIWRHPISSPAPLTSEPLAGGDEDDFPAGSRVRRRSTYVTSQEMSELTLRFLAEDPNAFAFLSVPPGPGAPPPLAGPAAYIRQTLVEAISEECGRLEADVCRAGPNGSRTDTALKRLLVLLMLPYWVTESDFCERYSRRQLRVGGGTKNNCKAHWAGIIVDALGRTALAQPDGWQSRVIALLSSARSKGAAPGSPGPFSRFIAELIDYWAVDSTSAARDCLAAAKVAACKALHQLWLRATAAERSRTAPFPQPFDADERPHFDSIIAPDERPDEQPATGQGPKLKEGDDPGLVLFRKGSRPTVLVLTCIADRRTQAAGRRPKPANGGLP